MPTVAPPPKSPASDQTGKKPDQKDKKSSGGKTKFDVLTLILFLGAALLADIGSIWIPGLGTIFIGFCRLMFWLVLDISTPKLNLLMNASGIVGGIVEVIPAVSILPAAILFIVITYVGVKIEEKLDKALAIAGSPAGQAAIAVAAGAAGVATGGAGAVAVEAGAAGAGAAGAGAAGAGAAGAGATGAEVAGAGAEVAATPEAGLAGPTSDQFGTPGPMAGSKPGESPYAQPGEKPAQKAKEEESGDMASQLQNQAQSEESDEEEEENIPTPEGDKDQFGMQGPQPEAGPLAQPKQ